MPAARFRARASERASAAPSALSSGLASALSAVVVTFALTGSRKGFQWRKFPETRLHVVLLPVCALHQNFVVTPEEFKLRKIAGIEPVLFCSSSYYSCQRTAHLSGNKPISLRAGRRRCGKGFRDFYEFPLLHLAPPLLAPCLSRKRRGWGLDFSNLPLPCPYPKFHTYALPCIPDQFCMIYCGGVVYTIYRCNLLLSF